MPPFFSGIKLWSGRRLFVKYLFLCLNISYRERKARSTLVSAAITRFMIKKGAVTACPLFLGIELRSLCWSSLKYLFLSFNISYRHAKGGRHGLPPFFRRQLTKRIFKSWLVPKLHVIICYLCLLHGQILFFFNNVHLGFAAGVFR